MKILEDNWKEIVAKVVKPLWVSEFQTMYKSRKLDYDDFLSLAGYELTKAFATYKPEESGVLTFATNVLKLKPKTELRNESRDKRLINSQAVSMNERVSEDSESTFEDLINDSYISENTSSEIYLMVEEILRQLKTKERAILALACDGHNNEMIAKSVNMTVKEVIDIRKKISESSSIKRIARKYGYFGGTEDEI